MPAHNEEQAIRPALQRLCTLLDSEPYEYEVLVVDDGSVDATCSVVLKESLNQNGKIRAIRYQPNRGKGHALKTGFAHSRGDKIILMDSDLDINPRLLPLYLYATNTSDIVIGSKWHAVSEYKAPTVRKLLSLGFNSLVMLLTGVRVRDTQTGIKVFRRDALRNILRMQLVKRHAFDVELMTIAGILNLTIMVLPVRIHQQSRFSLKSVFYMLIDLLGIVYRARIIRWYQKNIGSDKPVYKPVVRL